jgi:hypothetical protein
VESDLVTVTSGGALRRDSGCVPLIKRWCEYSSSIKNIFESGWGANKGCQYRDLLRRRIYSDIFNVAAQRLIPLETVVI